MNAEALTRFLVLANATARCGAKCKRTGQPCRGAAMKGKARCRMHGGASTGPKAEGRERLRKLRWKHGRRSKEAIQRRSDAAATMREVRRLCAIINEGGHDD